VKEAATLQSLTEYLIQVGQEAALGYQLPAVWETGVRYGYSSA
jgi:hypothetical protein